MAIEIIQITTSIGEIVDEITVGLAFTVMPNTIFRVSKIAYCRKGYNKGNQGDYPAYKVEFENTKIRMIIPEKNIENMVTNIIEKKIKTPELPDELTELPETAEEEVEMTPPMAQPIAQPIAQGM